MKATEPYTICPYAGLRSFTEEESLYFKGRDLQVDQITALLEQNKFLMVTGASGDGKSSLVYAGLIPNARAGFFRARYSNWLIADFRPERDPIGNMAASLASQLQVSAATAETELRRGYSSLVDLYTSSPAYAAEEDPAFALLDDAERKEKKRKAANLLILLDQFEEFFTNPENYHNEAPSTDAQIVVNLVLETARIALKRNLPIYVVCTMRSDYIGQCSAFRGLPEYIGFSQFFVPRLKRKDLKQVIEEPAILSGNRITQRLIERLVFDVADGVDQLPILQHALSRVWQAADEGREEMDLLHYAMVGGMPPEDLPDEDQPRFYAWFNTIPEGEKKFYRQTGLSRIIDIHANLLYENAWSHHNHKHPGKPVSQKDAKRVIAIAFSCLTKIDNSRAVRNRMTLGEISRIVNNPDIPAEAVGNILDTFREEGNSFIRPFMTGDAEASLLHSGTVLDITHESLIRNWEKLNTWAAKEFEYYTTYLDFRKQMDRWKNSGKSRGFLLPIGPLTYFDNWYKSAKPNEGWLERYEAPADGVGLRSSVSSAQTLSDIREFLRKSTAREWVTRTFMKYGARRILSFLAMAIMLGLTAYYWYDAEQKKNSSVIETVRSEAAGLVNATEVQLDNKALYLITEERYDSGSLLPALSRRAYRDRLPLAVEVYGQMLIMNKGKALPFLPGLRSFIMTDLEKPDTSAEPGLLLKQGNKMAILLAMDQYYNPDSAKSSALTRLVGKGQQLALKFYRNRDLYHNDIPAQLNLALQYWLTFGQVSPEKVNELLASISPRSSAEAESHFHLYYPEGSFEPNGKLMNDLNGGLHTLASLYAAAGDTAGITWSFTRLLETRQRNYFEMARVLNNHVNVIGYLYQYGHRELVPGILAWIGSHTADNPPITLMRNVVLRSGYISHIYYLNLQQSNGIYRATSGYIFPNLYFCSREQFDAMWADHEYYIRQEKDVNERNFQLAMSAKRKVMFYDKYGFDRKMPADNARLDAWSREAVDLYRKTDSAYLEGSQSVTLVYNGDGVRTGNIRRRDLFLYPDYRDGWFAWTFHTNRFFEFLHSKGLLPSLYPTGQDLQNLHLWLAKAFEWKAEITSEEYSNPYSLPDSTIRAVLDFAGHHPEGSSFDRNLPVLVLANRAFARGDSTEGIRWTHELDMVHMKQSINRYEYLERIFMVNMVNDLAAHLALAGKGADMLDMVNTMQNDRQKAMAYFTISENLYRERTDPEAFRYLDSGFTTLDRIPYVDISADVEPRFLPIRLLSEIGGREINAAAAERLRELPEPTKFLGVLNRVAGIAFEGNYHLARTAIPSSLTESQDLVCHILILLEASKAREKAKGDKSWAPMDHALYWWFTYNNYYPT
jgi:hypothetical protein